MGKINENIFAFLSILETENNEGFIGAILITDENGIPQEFRCTHSIKPTTIQKALYENKLEPHIGMWLCGIPLLNAVQSGPCIVFTEKDYLLGMRPELITPIIALKRAGETINIESSSANNWVKKEKIENKTGNYQPIVASTHPDFAEELNISKEKVNSLFESFDILEPFERIKKAIEILGKQDNKFK